MQTEENPRNYAGSWIVTQPRAQATRAGVGERPARGRVASRARDSPSP